VGRSARTPAFLDGLGYRTTVADRSTTNANYTSLLLRIPDGIIKERAGLLSAADNTASRIPAVLWTPLIRVPAVRLASLQRPQQRGWRRIGWPSGSCRQVVGWFVVR